jgi:hypothetical protein
MSSIVSGLITARRGRLAQTTCLLSRRAGPPGSGLLRAGCGFLQQCTVRAFGDPIVSMPTRLHRLIASCALRKLQPQFRGSPLPAPAHRAPVSALSASPAFGRPARYTSHAGLTRRLSGTANGVPPGPRSRLCNHRLRGPGGTPSAAA